jgi:hypothetical protein
MIISSPPGIPLCRASPPITEDFPPASGLLRWLADSTEEKGMTRQIPPQRSVSLKSRPADFLKSANSAAERATQLVDQLLAEQDEVIEQLDLLDSRILQTIESQQNFERQPSVAAA